MKLWIIRCYKAQKGDQALKFLSLKLTELSQTDYSNPCANSRMILYSGFALCWFVCISLKMDYRSVYFVYKYTHWKFVVIVRAARSCILRIFGPYQSDPFNTILFEMHYQVFTPADCRVSIFCVEGNWSTRRKPTIFGRALTYTLFTWGLGWSNIDRPQLKIEPASTNVDFSLNTARK